MHHVYFAWQRPTLTGGKPPITIGAKELNYCVRYGNRCDLFAIVTKLMLNELIHSKLNKTNISTTITVSYVFIG